MGDPQNSKPDLTENGLELGHSSQETKRAANAGVGRGTHQASSRTRIRKICEVLTDDKDFFKVIADARSKLENEPVLPMPSVLMEDGRGGQCSCSTVIEATPDSSESVCTEG